MQAKIQLQHLLFLFKLQHQLRFNQEVAFHLDHEWFTVVFCLSLKVFFFQNISTRAKHLLNSYLINCTVLETTHIQRAFVQQVHCIKVVSSFNCCTAWVFQVSVRFKILLRKKYRTKGSEDLNFSLVCCSLVVKFWLLFKRLGFHFQKGMRKD